jgi:SAM-dependent methyltransferase
MMEDLSKPHATSEAVNVHYDSSYFAWQRSGGELVAIADRWKFERFIHTDDTVLDFGCGGGYLLATFPCRTRYGVELNAVARREAAQVLDVVEDIDQLSPDVQFDVIISHHALEHVDAPLYVLRKLRDKLKMSGKIVFVVPSESWHKQREYRADDINQHLYTWTPLLLGNLFARAGFHVESVDLLCHRWLPKSEKLRRLVPASFFDSRLFHLGCWLWSAVTRSRQIRIVASRSQSEPS